jgi:hypothetical protein
MNRSKLSVKAITLVSGIGLAAAALGGSQPAVAQSYSDDYSCPAGLIYDPSYGCTLSGDAYQPYDYGYSPYYGGDGSYYGGRRFGSGHGFAHGMGGGFAHDLGGSINRRFARWRPCRRASVSGMAAGAISAMARAAGTARAVNNWIYCPDPLFPHSGEGGFPWFRWLAFGRRYRYIARLEWAARRVTEVCLGAGSLTRI